jgi:F0F1-type ATP synthase membrane subunit b/b'
MTEPAAPPPTIVVPGAGWVDVATRAITQVGFPVVIAGVLLWFVLGKFQSNMEAITTRMQDNTQTARGLIDSFHTELAELQVQTAELRKQSETMKDIAERTGRLLELRQEERREQREHLHEHEATP